MVDQPELRCRLKAGIVALSGKLFAVMRLRLVLLFSLLLPLPALAGDNLVRVEVLVFKHGDGQPDAWPADQLEDFNALLDPRRRARLAAWTARYREDSDDEPGEELPWQEHQWSRPGVSELELTGPVSPADPVSEEPATASVLLLDDASPGPLWPERFVQLDRLSSPMQRAYERLGNSASHEVLSVTGWLQPLERGEPSPIVRVHDETPLSVDWLSPPALPFAVDDVLTRPSQMPESIYRLDGGIRIRRRQFRHADINLVWSQRRPQASPLDPEETGGYEVHRMQLTRPIQLGRMEYFDSPWLGVLILVEPWEPETS